MRYKPEATDLLGTFEVVDDTLRISDPCYDPGTWCAGNVENAKHGTWNAYVVHGKTDWGRRCWELIAIHSDYPKSLRMTEKTDIDVGVDSGQAGIFTQSAYLGGDEGGDSEGDGFYGICCSLTCDTKLSAGVLEGGCVSSAGYGDGSYDCFIARDGLAAAVGVRIVYITEADFEEEENEAGL